MCLYLSKNKKRLKLVFSTFYDVLGAKWSNFLLDKLPGFYRNAELAVLPLFSRNTNISSLWAKTLLKYEDRTRFLDEQKTIPLRPYYQPKLAVDKNCTHQPDSPSVWCLKEPQFVNQNNPIFML